MTKINVLDKGFVKLVDVMGDDSSIVQAARVSYGNGTKTPSEDKKLINYLMKNRHTSPFEMCELKFHVKCPIFIARQWMRHRTASINEVSARYSVVEDDFYLPDINRIKFQSQTNKQGSGESLPEDEANIVLDTISLSSKVAKRGYDLLIEMGVSREIARIILPLNTYTEFYWKIDLHNLLNFIRLRSDHHAQWEIQEYSRAIETVIADKFPIAFDAFKKYNIKSEEK